MSRLNFKLQATASGSRARAGSFHTLHNEVLTPVFMPVGTLAAVRGQHPENMHDLGYSVLLANTYHLMLRPGAEVFEKMGGISKFMGWQRSVLTDSGGYQIFSLPNERQMSEQGALFKSYVDQRNILLTPEKSIAMQKSIGSDIMMVLDHCIASTAEFECAKDAMDLTHRWAERSFEARGESLQSLFGIVQGACFPSLRKMSAAYLSQIPFDGFAIGGLAVGESKQLREDITEFTAELLPTHLPRYLMGVGTPLDLLEAVHRGVDMFDCILPTALGQQGLAFTSRGKVDLRRGAYKFVDDKLDPQCSCSACRRHSISYLHHLIRIKESLGSQLVANHNLVFYAKLMREMRESILADTFVNFYKAKKEAFSKSDRNFPVAVIKTAKDKRRKFLLGKYEVHETAPKIFSIRHVPSGEIMHSINDPSEEANTLYTQQSKIIERVQEAHLDELVIWDVGLGAAINAMSALMAYEKAAPKRSLKIISFENDLDSLRLALKYQNLFLHLRHGAPVALLEKHTWSSKKFPVTWNLLEGDFLEKMETAPVPDIIFFDPFSYKTDQAVWAINSFQKLFQICGGHSTEVFTYSSSTAVRVALLAAGFSVARGVRTGPRLETTIALTPKAVQNFPHHQLLGHQWLDRWERSHAKYPSSINTADYVQFENTIRSHAQFKKTDPKNQ